MKASNTDKKTQTNPKSDFGTFCGALEATLQTLDSTNQPSNVSTLFKKNKNSQAPSTSKQSAERTQISMSAAVKFPNTEDEKKIADIIHDLEWNNLDARQHCDTHTGQVSNKHDALQILNEMADNIMSLSYHIQQKSHQSHSIEHQLSELTPCPMYNESIREQIQNFKELANIFIEPNSHNSPQNRAFF